MDRSESNIYCFDTSIFVRINQFYPIPDLWIELESLINTESLISHEFVLQEINPNTKNPDSLGKWIKDKTNIFRIISQRQIEIVREIIVKFPGLIDYKKEKDEADPWVIALAKEEIEKKSLFPEENKNVILASAESERSSQKIPAVCKYYSVPHMNFFEFLEDRGMSLSISR